MDSSNDPCSFNDAAYQTIGSPELRNYATWAICQRYLHDKKPQLNINTLTLPKKRVNEIEKLVTDPIIFGGFCRGYSFWHPNASVEEIKNVLRQSFLESEACKESNDKRA